MQQHELRQPQGATHRKKRIGRGNASGHGTYSGKGLKGQKARAGGGGFGVVFFDSPGAWLQFQNVIAAAADAFRAVVVVYI